MRRSKIREQASDKDVGVDYYVVHGPLSAYRRKRASKNGRIMRFKPRTTLLRVMLEKNMPDRRDFLKSATAALTTSIFTGQIRGANDRVAAAFIGMGKMGRSNLQIAMKQENLVPVAVCDVYERNLEWAVRGSKNQAKPYRDFREILADKSIDVVCISTPDHSHAYMTGEACKARQEVHAGKPRHVGADEGVKMVEAARK